MYLTVSLRKDYHQFSMFFYVTVTEHDIKHAVTRVLFTVFVAKSVLKHLLCTEADSNQNFTL